MNETQALIKITKELEHLNANIRALTDVLKEREENQNDNKDFYFAERWEPGTEGVSGYDYKGGVIHSGQ